MYFNFRVFYRTVYLSFFKWRNTHSRFIMKRLIFLIAFFLSFPIVQLFNALCLFIDDIIFPDYQKVKLEKAVFIMGNPRSGTTFIHRVMAQDKDQFFCFRTWEIIFPAIIQKKVIFAIRYTDQLMGSVFSKLIKNFESRLFRNFNKMHQISLFSPEEDDNLLIHAFSHLNLVWFFPFFDEFKQFGQFDELVRPEDRMRIMTFYKNCIKRQAYFSGSKGYFLSKSPSACSKIGSLYKHFPGCKIVYMIRNPLEVIPSMVNMAHEIWHSTINIEAGFPFQDKVYEILKYYYTYPLDQLEREPQNAYEIIKYDDLVRQPQLAIQTACQRLGLELNTKFMSILKQEQKKARNYKSSHIYSIDQTHFTREQIVSDLHDIFNRFGFDT